jgi:hypothetical protein
MKKVQKPNNSVSPNQFLLRIQGETYRYVYFADYFKAK